MEKEDANVAGSCTEAAPSTSGGGNSSNAILLCSDWTAEQSLSLADSLYVDERFDDAVDAYTAALMKVSDMTRRHEHKKRIIQFRILSHRSAAFFQLERYQEALDDAKQAGISLAENKKDVEHQEEEEEQKQYDDDDDDQVLRPGETEVCLRREGLAAMWLRRYEDASLALSKAAQLARLNHSNATLYDPWLQQCEHAMQLTPANMPLLTGNAKLKAPKPEVTPKSRSHAAGPGHAAAAGPPPVTTTTTTTVTPATNLKTAPASSVAAAAAMKPAAVAVATTAATTTPLRTSATKVSAIPVIPKYQYYQSNTVMTICILEASVQPSDLRVEFEPQRILVQLRRPPPPSKRAAISASNSATSASSSDNNNSAGGGGDGTADEWLTVLQGTLYDDINVPMCKVLIKDEKVLLKLRKVKQFEWHELLKRETKQSSATPTKTAASAAAAASTTPTVTTPSSVLASAGSSDSDIPAGSQAAAGLVSPEPKKLARPYSSHKDWDAIEKEIKEEEAKEKPVGDEAMNKLFQQIYSNADEDTRRAMIKSYQTSGGTVLNTNWKEVAAKDYEKERTAPKGMEWKTWEGDKLPMKDDDE